jgi:NADH:ubiquinone oxidoreductase subunit 3 (subunit A)
VEALLWPPIAFVLYLALAGALSGIGRLLAGAPSPSALKSSTYASGEEAPPAAASPGYKPFFRIALFFALVHLGALVLASGTFTPGMALYLGGLMVVLIVLATG